MLTRKVPELPPLLNRANTPTSRLLRYWPLNEGSGAPRDLVRGGRATISGATWGTDIFGQRLLFDGADDSMSEAVDLSGTDKITISCWFWWDVFAQDDDLLCEYFTNSNSNPAFHIDPNQATNSQFAFSLTAAGALSNAVRIVRPTAAAWHHLVWIADRSHGTAATAHRIFMDGVLQSPTVIASDDVTGNFGNSTLHFMHRSGPTLCAAGRLQNFALFKGRISDAEAFSLYTNRWQLLAPYSRPRMAQLATTGVTGTAAILERGF